MRQVSVATVQWAPKLGKIDENLERMGRWVDDICFERKVDLIVFPELATSGYECGVQFAEVAVQVPGYVVEYMANRAIDHDVHLVFGLVEKHRVESVLYDSAVLIDPHGDVMTTYRKVHLRGEERLAFRPGYKFVTAETSFGSLGLLIGWDLAFPEAARTIMLQGAELLAVPANWERPHMAAWRNYVLTRALENSMYVAAANRIGEEPTYSFFGNSLIVGPRAEVYSSLDEDVEGYGLVTIDLDEVRKQREDSQLLQVRQPRAYRDIVKMY